MSRSTYGDCHGLRGASLLPAGPQTGQPGPKQPVGGMEPWTRDRLLIDGHLVSQSDDLKLQSETRAEQRR